VIGIEPEPRGVWRFEGCDFVAADYRQQALKWYAQRIGATVVELTIEDVNVSEKFLWDEDTGEVLTYAQAIARLVLDRATFPRLIRSSER
jgi:hypothetical protein